MKCTYSLKVQIPIKRVKLYRVGLIMLLYGWAQYPGFAQDLKVELNQMRNAYKDLTSFSVKVRIKVYESDFSSRLMMEHHAFINKDKSSFLVTLGKLTMLYTDTIGLIVNPETRTITCSPYDPEKVDPNMAVTGLDSLLRQVDIVKYNGIEAGAKHYSLIIKKNVIKQTELFFSPTNHRIVKIIYHYNDVLTKNKTKVVIDYLNFNATPVFPKDFFSVYKYLSLNDNCIRPSSGYRNFEVQFNF